jgi:hypothetical protein
MSINNVVSFEHAIQLGYIKKKKKTNQELESDK